MLNKQLLQDPASAYHATTEQAAAISRLEDEAVTKTLSDHHLPAGQAAAVRSWRREAVMAQLWALMIKAIRTDPGSRSADQAHVVTWLAQMMNRKAEEAALNAGWEYLQWAGRLSSADPRPPAAEILSELRGFENGTRQPVGYMFGTAANSDSGYCDYLPPTGFEAQYDGNASKPGSSAGAWCFPPYQCPDPLGCDNRQPDLQSFLTWGEADVHGDPTKDSSFAYTAKGVSKDLILAGAALGAGVGGLALGASLGAGAVGSAVATAVFPFAAQLLVDFGWVGITDAMITAAESIGATMVATSITAAVTIAVVAITIAVMKGIAVTEDAELAVRLRQLVSNALAGEQDLQPMLTDTSDLTGLFSLFIRATGPIPEPETCDNTQVVVGGPLVVPCGNLTAIPVASPEDLQFEIQRLTQQSEPVGSPVRSDTLTWVDSANSATIVGSGKYWTNQARLSDGWLVRLSDAPGRHRLG